MDVQLELERLRRRLGGAWTVVARFREDGTEHLVLRQCAGAVPRLTPREAEVVERLALGQHMKLVAYELGISYATVRVLAARARAKLGHARGGEPP